MLPKNINELKPKLALVKAKYQLKSMALFGSVLREDFREDSDIDILVDFQSDDFVLFLQLADELEEMLNHKVDLVTSRSLKPRQLDYIQNQLIYVWLFL